MKHDKEKLGHTTGLTGGGFIERVERRARKRGREGGREWSLGTRVVEEQKREKERMGDRERHGRWTRSTFYKRT